VTILFRLVALLTVLYAVTAAFVWVGPLGSVGRVPFLIAHGVTLIVLASAAGWIRFITPRNQAMIAFRDQQLEHAATLEQEATERDFAARFTDACDLADTEPDAYDAVHRGLRLLGPDRPSELLMADSSRANLRPVTVAGPDDVGPGCPVPSPSQCAALRVGRTVLYEDSEALDACPQLRDRSGSERCSAACVPVNVLGRSIGVLHTVGEAGETPPSSQVRGLETIARVAGARVAMVRALSETETAAGTDALTGLMNRRQLEGRTRMLMRGSVDFAVVVADLDYFRQLNDTHGRETGDRALRVFAEVCSATLRPDDLVCRFGGEEFVLIFPRTSTKHAVTAVERLRGALAERLLAGEVPSFTSSFGMASSGDGETLDEMLLVADRALYQAKAAGRDRIVIAGRAASPEDEYDDIVG